MSPSTMSPQSQTALPRTGGIALLASPGRVLSQHGQAALGLLAAYERQRAGAIRSMPARCSYIAAHLLVRQAAAALTGLPEASFVLEQRCAQCGGPHGQPSFRGHPALHVSFSHCDAAVAAVVARAPVAIDVESFDVADLDGLLAAPAFSPAERRRLAGIHDRQRLRRELMRLWVRKECLVKLGRLSLDTMASCDLCTWPAAPDDGTVAVHRHEGSVVTDWTWLSRRVVGAVLSSEPVELHRLDAASGEAGGTNGLQAGHAGNDSGGPQAKNSLHRHTGS